MLRRPGWLRFLVLGLVGCIEDSSYGTEINGDELPRQVRIAATWPGRSGGREGGSARTDIQKGVGKRRPVNKIVVFSVGSRSAVSIPGEENLILTRNLPLDGPNPGSSLFSMEG